MNRVIKIGKEIGSERHKEAEKIKKIEGERFKKKLN